MNRKYRPSNGTEGMWFEDKFCSRCIHEKWIHTQNDNDKKCDIFNRALIHDVNEPEYPHEWTYDANDKPTCLNWKKWDWGNDDDRNDPDDPDNPDAPIPVSPNQLCFPFILDEIGEPEPVHKINTVLIKKTMSLLIDHIF